ncbi:Plasma membrane calcium-transporting ATPase 2, partial [Quaeritorhiza haematococci]
EADVGFAKGLSGHQIAMNASDIILLDDSFVSMVQSIKWGQNVLGNVQKFLQFQLTVNVVAVSITLVGSALSKPGIPPFSTVELLWLNLIMDSLGAVALASDVPTNDLLVQQYGTHKQKGGRQKNRQSGIITPPMLEHMATQIVYQGIVLFGLYFGYDFWYALPKDDMRADWYPSKRTRTMVFATVLYHFFSVLLLTWLKK